MESDKNKIDPSIYRYILKHTKKDQVFLLLLTLLSMPVIYASLEIPKIIINQALSGHDIPDRILGFPVEQVSYLLLLCLAFLILVLIAGGLKYLTNVYRGIVGERMLRRFRYDLFSRILRFPNSRFKQVSQAELLPMVTTETEPLGGFIGDAIALPAFQGGLLLTYMLFIFNQDLWLGLAAIALYPPQIYLIPKLQSKVNRLAKRRVQAVRHLSDRLGEAISGISDIHVNDTSHFEKAHISSRLGTIYRIRFEIYRRKFFIKFLNNFLGQLTPFFFFSIGGYFVIKGELTLGALVAVLAAYKDLATPWRELIKFYQITEDARVKYAQIIGQFQPDDMLSPELQEDQAIDIDLATSKLVGSALEYSDDDYVKSLDGVSLSVTPGEHIAIIGQPGSGCDQLAKLIVRLRNPDSGQLRLSEVSLAELSESVLGRKMAYVDQLSFVFNGTVRENLLYGLKNRPVTDFTYNETEALARKTEVSDSLASDNSTDDIQADWINTDSHGFESKQDFHEYFMEVLKVTGVDQDIYRLGLYSTINPDNQAALAEKIIAARRAFRELLESSNKTNLIELLSAEKYNIHLSVAENLFFGTPIGDDPNFHKLIRNPRVHSILDSTGLLDILFVVGIQTARVISEIFSDVPVGSPLFERFSFVGTDQLPALARLAKLDTDTPKETVEKTDLDILINVSLKLTVSLHRLGLITESIQNRIIDAHQLLRRELDEENPFIDFYNEGKIAMHLSIQDNILFGRIVQDQINARAAIGKMVDEIISRSKLYDTILEIGLEYNVGVAGGRLTTIQKQKLTLARALAKNPDILVVNDAVALFDRRYASQVTKSILEFRKGKTVIWIQGGAERIEHFDHVMAMDKGHVRATGTPPEILGNKELIASLD